MKHKGGQLMKLPDGKKNKVFISLLSSEGCISRGQFHFWFVSQTV